MRTSVLLVLVLFVAGCASKPDAVPAPTTNPQPHGWTLDCAQGAVERVTNALWGQTCEARASHTAGPKEEMWLAVNPKNPDNVVVGSKDLNPELSAKCVWNGLGVTHDGGKTWKDVSIGGKYADRRPTDPWYGYACNTDPDFRFDAKGDLHYGVEMYNLGTQNGQVPDPTGLFPSGYKVMLATSHDGGDTWPDVAIFHPDFLVITDYSRMTINPTTQSILETIGSDMGQRCHILASRDGGKTAAPPVEVQTKDGVPCNSGGQGAIAGSPTGTLVIVGNSIAARSTDDGLTWIDSNKLFTFKRIPGTFKESKYRITNNYEINYDLTDGPNKGTLYVTYAASDRAGDEADVYVRSSKDDGKTWSEASLVNDDAVGAHQWMPNVVVAGDGSVHVFYMDKRYDPAHKLIDITHAVSLDGGKTWKNERVSTVSYDGDLGVHQDGFSFIGDYLGVDAVGGDVWAGFPDASDGKITVTAAAHVHLYP